jgi:hypothetical protein
MFLARYDADRSFGEMLQTRVNEMGPISLSTRIVGYTHYNVPHTGLCIKNPHVAKPHLGFLVANQSEKQLFFSLCEKKVRSNNRSLP